MKLFHEHFEEFSKLKWELNHQIAPNFSITKKEILFEKFIASDLYDIIFYDAFGAHAQPEIWAPDLLKKCFDILNNLLIKERALTNMS